MKGGDDDRVVCFDCITCIVWILKDNGWMAVIMEREASKEIGK